MEHSFPFLGNAVEHFYSHMTYYCGILRWCFVTYINLHGQYHTGYQEQMMHWPEQPVNIIIKWLKDHSPSLVVADFGCGENLNIYTWVNATNTSTCICKFVLLVDILMTTRSIMIPGDARLARNVKNKVFSFDLVSKDPSVIACDMSNVWALPLPTFSGFRMTSIVLFSSVQVCWSKSLALELKNVIR